MSASSARRPLGFAGSTSSSHDEEEWRVASTTRGHHDDEYSSNGSSDANPQQWNRHSASTTHSSYPQRSLSPSTSSHSSASFSSSNHSHPAPSPSGLAPRVHRAVNEAMHANGLTIHPTDGDEAPAIQRVSSSSPSSITDKLRNLKMKSRAGRGATSFVGTGLGGVGGGGLERNTRAASAFVRRAPSEDELDHQMAERGYELQRPASNMSHYPTGSMTPSGVAPKNPFSGQALERARREAAEEMAMAGGGYEPISTNSSYESIHGGSSSASALANLKGRARDRRTPAGIDPSNIGAGGVKGGPGTPSSPSSNNSSISFTSAYPNRHSTSPMPAPGHTDSSSNQPVRRQRFTSEPAQPHPHLQIHSPAAQQAHPQHQQPQTAFGAARHAHHASLSSNGPPASSYAQHYASLMDEAEEHQHRQGDSPISPMVHQPYSAAFESVAHAAAHMRQHSPYVSSGPSGGGGAASSAYHADDRPIGVSSRVQRDDDRPLHGAATAASGGGGGGSSASNRHASADDRPLGGSSQHRGLAHQDSFGGGSDGGYHSPMNPDESPASSSNGGSASRFGMSTPSSSSGHPSAKDQSNSKWDLTPAQAREMGMDFSLPPPSMSAAAADGYSANPGSAVKKRPKPLFRATTATASAGAAVPSAASRPSLSIPPSPSSVNAFQSGHPIASPTQPPLISPARPRNPRVSTTTGGGGFGTPGGPLGSPNGLGSSGGGGVGAQEEGNYVASCDLLPIPSGASSEVTPTLKSLQSSDWAVRFDALTTLRRLLVHHSGFLVAHTKSIVRDLRAEVNSLRSSLAKNAIMALSDAFTSQPRAFESELEQVGPPLLKRAGEPSGFLREEAHRALMTMLTQCSDRATLPFLLNASATGTKIVKTMACVYLDRAVEVYSSRANGGAVLQANKEWPRLLKAIGIFSSDAAVESRTHSRWSLIRLARFMGVDELERTMKRVLPAAHYHAVNKVLAKGMDQLNGELNASAPPPFTMAMVATAALHATSPLAVQSSPSGKRAPTASASHHASLQSSPTSASYGDSEYISGGTGTGTGGGTKSRATSSYGHLQAPASSYSVDSDGGLNSTAGSLSGGEEAASAASGIDSIARKRRPRPAVSATGSATSSTAASLEGTPATSGWGSIKASKSPNGSPVFGALGGTGGGGNLFDLDNPDFNSGPVSATSSVSAPAPARSSTAVKRRPTISSAGGAGQGHVSPQDAEKLQGVLGELASPDWRTRMSALEKLRAFIQATPSAVGPKIIPIYDLLCQRINDMHGKVNIAALQSLAQIIPLTKAHLSVVLGNFIPSLAQQLASTNPQVRQLCQSGLDQLLTTLESPAIAFTKDLQSAVLQPYAQVALFENVKIRPLMIEKLTGVLVACADACDAQGQPAALATFKSAIPVAYSLCEETRVEIKTPLLKFAQVLHAILGAACWDEKVCMQFHISNSQVTKFKAIIGAV